MKSITVGDFSLSLDLKRAGREILMKILNFVERIFSRSDFLNKVITEIKKLYQDFKPAFDASIDFLIEDFFIRVAKKLNRFLKKV